MAGSAEDGGQGGVRCTVPRIRSGTLAPGATLPTVQQLAATHHVAASTAYRAITQLAHEHLIASPAVAARRSTRRRCPRAGGIGSPSPSRDQ